MTAQWLATAQCGYPLTQEPRIKLWSLPGVFAIESQIHRGEKGSFVVDAAVLLETLKGPLLSRRLQKKAKSAHAVGLFTEGPLHVSLTMRWCWLLPGEAETGLFRVQ